MPLSALASDASEQSTSSFTQVPTSWMISSKLQGLMPQSPQVGPSGIPGRFNVSTSLLMQRFYENWTGAYTGTRDGDVSTPLSKVESLHEDKERLRSWRDSSGRTPYAAPYYWAGFILMGDPR